MPTRTAAAEREASKEAYNAYLATCPSRQVLATLADKWVILVMHALEDEPQRYSQLSRHIAGVSQKMLTQTLRSLERDGLVVRTVEPTVPVTVTYELTRLGSSLVQVVSPLKQWAETHIEAIRDSQAEYDLRA